MKPLLTALALSTGLVFSPAIANQPEVPPRSIQVDSDDSNAGASTQAEQAAREASAVERQELARPLEEMPKVLERRYEQK